MAEIPSACSVRPDPSLKLTCQGRFVRTFSRPVGDSMKRDEIAALFDQQAAGYDTQWLRMSPVREGLFFLLEAAFATLPPDTRVLSAGAGTGIEIEFLATRCTFHHGFLESLASDSPYDGATCLLVSQFLTDPAARQGLFGDIATRLRPGGILVNADLASDISSPEYESLLAMWLDRMSSAGVPPEALARARAAYAKDAAVLPPAQVAALIAAAGFDAPTPFLQAGLMHAWCATRARREAARQRE